MKNLDPLTVLSFGDEWLRFDQHSMTPEEAERVSATISLSFHGMTFLSMPRALTWVAALAAGLDLWLLV